MSSLSDFLVPFARRSREYLERWLLEPGTPDSLADVMRYCVLSGGKRLRPALVFLAAEAAGGGESDELTARSAFAVELVHCYSLVHDDLPAMDNDELRRGRPTAHVRFGEAMAILAGDALLTRAFAVLGEADDPRVGPLVRELARGAGPGGMVAGQVADMGLCEIPSGAEGPRYIHLHKTAALIRAAATMGAICADADDRTLRAIAGYGESIGLAFQLIDDLLDVTGRAETVGKATGKDQTGGKRTYVTELGLTEARRLAEALTAQAAEAVELLGRRGRKLQALAGLLGERDH